ncbi:hypothetical protein WME99_08565 [Sorangium sp. So ce136]|uniref:hypothetical protein n=1 Tax=Sorangium sp. So ce136 TaxID=3133284 RepID=UPI003F09ED69
MNPATRLQEEDDLASSAIRTSPHRLSSEGATRAVDLVVLIESGDAMKDLADTFSKVVGTAIGVARTRGIADPSVTYLGIDGVFPYSVFMVTVRGYLTMVRKVDESSLSCRPRSQRTGRQDQASAHEQGNAGHALVDILTHFNWRPGAARNVLFLGHGPLDGLRCPPPAGERDVEVASRIVELATRVGARVHMGLADAGRSCSNTDTHGGWRQRIEAEYERVAVETGGQVFIAQGSLFTCLEMIESALEGSTPDARVTPVPGARRDEP